MSHTSTNILYTLYAALSLSIHALASKPDRRDLITTTVYETVSSPNNSTLTLQCGTSLSHCDEITWGGLGSYSGYSVLTNSTIGESTLIPLTSADSVTSRPRTTDDFTSTNSGLTDFTIIPSPNSPSSTTSAPPASSSFVLQGSGAYKNYFFQFNGDNGKVVLGTLGQKTLVSLQLREDGVLQNAADSSQIVFLRYNSTFAQSLSDLGEDNTITDVIREVRFGSDEYTLSPDYTFGWFWDTTANQPVLSHEGVIWSFVTDGTPGERLDLRDINNKNSQNIEADQILYERDGLLYLDMLPDNVALPPGSSFQRAVMSPNSPQQFSTYLSTLVPTSTPTASSSPLQSSSPPSPSSIP
ncbi:hypothetical protein AA313_de0202443 [Arthrobotrys entomopaga]|nr:hypothetical protein AA313_de0202443 [Arthrobotrys entomopaga]